MIKKRNNLKINAPLIVSYAIFIILSMILTISLILLKNVSSKLTGFYNNNYATTTNAWTARQNIQKTKALLFEVTVETDQEKTLDLVEEIKTCMIHIRKDLDEIKIAFPQESNLIDEVITLLDKGLEYQNQILEYASANRNSEAQQILISLYGPLLDNSAIILTTITENISANTTSMVADRENAITTTFFTLLTVDLISIVIAIVIALLTAYFSSKKN